MISGVVVALEHLRTCRVVVRMSAGHHRFSLVGPGVERHRHVRRLHPLRVLQITVGSTRQDRAGEGHPEVSPLDLIVDNPDHFALDGSARIDRLPSARAPNLIRPAKRATTSPSASRPATTSASFSEVNLVTWYLVAASCRASASWT